MSLTCMTCGGTGGKVNIVDPDHAIHADPDLCITILQPYRRQAGILKKGLEDLLLAWTRCDICSDPKCQEATRQAQAVLRETVTPEDRRECLGAEDVANFRKILKAIDDWPDQQLYEFLRKAGVDASAFDRLVPK